MLSGGRAPTWRQSRPGQVLQGGPPQLLAGSVRVRSRKGPCGASWVVGCQQSQGRLHPVLAAGAASTAGLGGHSCCLAGGCPKGTGQAQPRPAAGREGTDRSASRVRTQLWLWLLLTASQTPSSAPPANAPTGGAWRRAGRLPAGRHRRTGGARLPHVWVRPRCPPTPRERGREGCPTCWRGPCWRARQVVTRAAGWLLTARCAHPCRSCRAHQRAAAAPESVPAGHWPAPGTRGRWRQPALGHALRPQPDPTPLAAAWPPAAACWCQMRAVVRNWALSRARRTLSCALHQCQWAGPRPCCVSRCDSRGPSALPHTHCHCHAHAHGP
mmetsp:Transcript_315/g.794  ORF Transcript_315/g.794 Transcript_315/m.794 type:complete len:327 (+) Transcript_315:204-1184(+)